MKIIKTMPAPIAPISNGQIRLKINLSLAFGLENFFRLIPGVLLRVYPKKNSAKTIKFGIWNGGYVSNVQQESR